MRRLASACCASLLFSLAACESDELTQLVVVVDSDTDRFTRVEIDLEGFDYDEPITADLDRDGALPRRLAIVHQGGPMGPFGVTVRASTDDLDDVLVEPRSGLFFERHRTMMLKVDLLEECIGECPDQACLGAGRCVDSDDEDAIELRPWTGDPDALPVTSYADSGVITVRPDGQVVVLPDDASTPMQDASDAAKDGALDTGPANDATPQDDAGPVMATSLFLYTPQNFDPAAAGIPTERTHVVLDCGVSEFDSSTLGFTNFCQSGEPWAKVHMQSDGSEAALVVMDTLRIVSGATLRLTGSRPVIFAVFGDAQIQGTVDASASGTTSGPGGGIACEAGRGGTGADGTGDPAAAGGGGGGFGSPGAVGGASDSVAGATAGVSNGDSSLSPLRGGCPGGAGGKGDGDTSTPGGGGGGAVQFSTAGRFDLDGAILASGGGGAAGLDFRDGGGGGGSGGAILLEGSGVDFDSAAVVSANGGGGGGGQPTRGTRSAAGEDGQSGQSAASGGRGENSGGDGGNGAAQRPSAEDGQDGEMSVLDTAFGAGGGGGGGTGRIRLNRALDCTVRGIWSPMPVVDCPACGGCPEPPNASCVQASFAGALYFLCSERVNWETAQQRCEAVGLGLARIDDAQENAFIADSITIESWLGGSDRAMEGEWRWSDNGAQFWMGGLVGSEVGDLFSAWSAGQPDGSFLDEDCLNLRTDAGWQDAACEAMRGYVCE